MENKTMTAGMNAVKINAIMNCSNFKGEVLHGESMGGWFGHFVSDTNYGDRVQISVIKIGNLQWNFNFGFSYSPRDMTETRARQFGELIVKASEVVSECKKITKEMSGGDY